MNQKFRWMFQWNGPIVISGLIALLVALLLPAIQQAREAARRTQSKNNLKQIGMALFNYESGHNMFPPGGVFNTDGQPFHGWMTMITPYIDSSPIYNMVNFNIPWDHPDQIDDFQPGYGRIFQNPSIPVCCGEDGLMQVHYSGSDVIFYHNSSTRVSDLTNGTSQTLFVGDVVGDFEPFGYAYHWRDATLGLNSAPNGFGCSVRPVTQMAMADCSVRVFGHETDKDLFVSLRGENSQSKQTRADVSKPLEPYRISPPIVCLWVDRDSGSSLLGVQDESQQVVRAWFLNSGWTWHEYTPPKWDQQAELLKQHKSLRELNLRDALSDIGIRVLRELPNLTTVQVAGNSVTDRGFQYLSEYPQLTHLKADSTALGNHGWKALAKSPHLKSIKIEMSWRDPDKFLPDAVVKFLDQKPDCKVVVSRGRTIQIETIRELAKNNEQWPPFDSER